MEGYTIITERITKDIVKKWDLVVPNGPYNITEIQELMFKLKGSGYMNVITWEKFQRMLKNR
jgi:hypothetical protein